jgi:hypothetical protein
MLGRYLIPVPASSPLHGTLMSRFLIFILICIVCCSSSANAQIDVYTNSTGNSKADAAFLLASETWAGEFSDDMSLFLNYSFASMDQETVSIAQGGKETFSYSDFWQALGDDVTSNDDASMFSSMPTGTSFSMYINRTTEASGSSFERPYVDNDGGANNSFVELTSANSKALNLKNPHAAIVDGFVVFNSDYNWDYDPTNGIEDEHMDFFGIALHEIGHTLGFDSGIDVLDANGEGQFDDDELPFVTALDFLRFSNESELAGADIDWTADQRSKYFSIDGGLTPAATGSSHWSTGEIYGNGEQNSHWLDGAGLGVMDPTTDFGLVNSISGHDLLAFDVIGYNRNGFNSVPEPGSFGVLLLCGSLLLRRRRS